MKSTALVHALRNSVGLKKLCQRMRRVHSLAAPVVALPLLLIVVTGIVLLVRREFDALHPATRPGSQAGITLTVAEIVAAVQQAEPELVPSGLDDIKELRIVPRQGITKVRLKDWTELQVDNHTGAILHTGQRWSALLIGLHEGTYFSLYASYLVYLPASILLLVLWFSGILIFWGQRRWKKTRVSARHG